MVKADGSFMKRPTKGELERALLKACMLTRWGQVCYRTSENVPMGMPKNVEKVVAPVVRAALGKSGG